MIDDRTRKVLKEARALVANGWTRGANARNIRGVEVMTNDVRACSFCMWGAIKRSTGGSNKLLDDTVSLVLKNLPSPDYSTLAEFNDEQKSKKPVLAVFDKLLSDD